MWNWHLKDSPLQERALFTDFARSLINGYAMLVSPIMGETSGHGCHCPRDMTVCMREVMVRPWVGVCAPCFDVLVIRDPLSPRMSWWNCCVPNQQLPHVLYGAGA